MTRIASRREPEREREPGEPIGGWPTESDDGFLGLAHYLITGTRRDEPEDEPLIEAYSRHFQQGEDEARANLPEYVTDDNVSIVEAMALSEFDDFGGSGEMQAFLAQEDADIDETVAALFETEEETDFSSVSLMREGESTGSFIQNYLSRAMKGGER